MKVETSSKAEEDEERESEDEDDELLLKKRKRGERKDSSDLKADEADEKSEEEKNLSYAELKRKAAARARQEKRELEKKDPRPVCYMRCLWFEYPRHGPLAPTCIAGALRVDGVVKTTLAKMSTKRIWNN